MANDESEFSLSKRGRKKAQPFKSLKVWNYFVDLKSSTGIDKIKCRHCDFETSDRSTQALTAHIKRNHSDGGAKSLWNALEAESNGITKTRNSSRIANLRGNKQMDVLEELSKQVATYGSVTMDKNDIVGLLQSFANKVDSNDVASIEDLVTALGEPTTSNINNPIGNGNSPTSNGSDFQTPDNNTLTTKNNNNNIDDWVFVGTFNNHQDVEAARNAGKVVRHSCIPTKEGSKVKYRCNQWKRTHCPYRMHYVEIDGIYTLYEKGEHEHTLILPTNTQAISTATATITSKIDESYNEISNNYMETDYLQSIISHAIQSTNTMEPKKDSLVISEFTAAPMPPPKIETNNSCLTLPQNLYNVFEEAVRAEPSEIFTLSSGTSISNLLQVATELQLVFTFDARNAAEFCFSSKTNNLQMVIVFVDEGNEVIVKTKHNDIIMNIERWRKADSPQFVWAVRGILAKTFCN